MLGITRSASAPNLGQAKKYVTQAEEPNSSSSLVDIFPGRATAQTQTSDKVPVVPSLVPSRLAFLCYVYVLVGIQVAAASLEWMSFTYYWQPALSIPERQMYVLLLLLTWANLSLGFLGFRRLQFKFPLNWVIFACIFESLTLLVMCLCSRELDLTWPFIVIGLSVLVIYTLLGLWVPKKLSADLWILILVSITVLIAAILALATGLAMRFYVCLSVCMIIFGPWAMYNAQKLHQTLRRGYATCNYLEAAVKMYINYGCTVGGVVLVNRMAIESLEAEGCKSSVFCQRSFPYGK